MPTITDTIRAAADHAHEAAESVTKAAEALATSDPLAAHALHEREAMDMAARLEALYQLAKDTPACQQEIQ